LYFWRNQAGVFIVQTLLLLAGAAMLCLWQLPVSAFLRFVFCIASSSLLLLQSEQAIKLVQEHALTIQDYLRALPVDRAKLERIAKFFCIVPACLLLIGFAILLNRQTDALYKSVAYWYFAIQLTGQFLLVLLGHFPRAVRVRVLMLCMVLLSAIGSELWK